MYIVAKGLRLDKYGERRCEILRYMVRLLYAPHSMLPRFSLNHGFLVVFYKKTTSIQRNVGSRKYILYNIYNRCDDISYLLGSTPNLCAYLGMARHLIRIQGLYYM